MAAKKGIQSAPGLWIPDELWRDGSFSVSEKIVLCYLVQRIAGVPSTDDGIAEALGMAKQSVSNIVSKFKRLDYIAITHTSGGRSINVLSPLLERVTVTTASRALIAAQQGGIVPEEKKNEVYKYWEEMIAPITTSQETQRKACVTLANRYGIEQCKKAIEILTYAHSDVYARKEVKLMSPGSLLENWDKLVIWWKGKQAQLRIKEKESEIPSI